MKKAVGVALGILAFVIAGASVYGIFSLNETIQAKPNTIQVSNYSAQLGSLQPQINSINNNMSSLGNLKGDITDIRGKLSDLESKINQVQQTSVSEKPVILLGKSAYFPGDTAYIIAVGLKPQKVVQIQLVDTNGIVVKQQDILADSGGRVAYSMQLSSTLVPGIFQIKLNTDQFVISQPVTIMQPSSGSVILSGLPYLFTAQPYRAVYQAGDLIRVSGIAQPYTSVNAVLTSPSGLTFTAATTTSSDGSYQVSILTSQSYERGNWYITLNNLGQIRQVSVFIGPVSSPSGPFTFTAQTDKAIYKKGDLIRVSGTAQPYISISSVLTSPSGKTYYGLASVNFDGSYGMYYSIMPSFETGVWHITLNSGVQELTVSIFIEPTS